MRPSDYDCSLCVISRGVVEFTLVTNLRNGRSAKPTRNMPLEP
jgi:hypothetical protein